MNTPGVSELLLASYLKRLRLPTMCREYPQVARQCGEAGRSFEEFLFSLSEREVSERENRAAARRIRQAGFPVSKDFAEYDFSLVPELNKQKVLELARGDYMAQKTNICLLGPAGTGKTHLAIAFGREACRGGRRVKFFTAAGLATFYAEAREQREVRRFEAQLSKMHLIVVDELGYVPLGQGAPENLFNFFSRCYEQVSVAVTTNLPFSEWTKVFRDERLTGALLDRFTHRIHILEVSGESFRFRQSRKRLEEAGAGGGQPV